MLLRIPCLHPSCPTVCHRTCSSPTNPSSHKVPVLFCLWDMLKIKHSNFMSVFYVQSNHGIFHYCHFILFYYFILPKTFPIPNQENTKKEQKKIKKISEKNQEKANQHNLLPFYSFIYFYTSCLIVLMSQYIII